MQRRVTTHFLNDGIDVDVIYNNEGILNKINLLGVVSERDLLYDKVFFDAEVGCDAFSFAWKIKKRGIGF